MAREFGELRAYFYDLDNLVAGTPVSVDGSTVLTDILIDSPERFAAASQIGSGRARLIFTNRSRDFAVPGRVCVIVQMMTGYTGIFERLMTVFIIENVEPQTDANGINVIDISGPGVEHLLTRYPVFEPIGEENVIETTLAENAPAPLSRTLAAVPTAWSNVVTLNDADDIEVGDELRIQDDAAQWETFEVVAVEPGGANNVVQFIPAIQLGFSSGNAVSIRRKRVKVASVAGLGSGQRVILELNSGTLETQIIEVSEGDQIVTIAHGIPGAANSGKSFDAYDYSAPSTGDVTQVLQHAGQWGATFQTGNGTAMGTAHKPEGESAFDILLSIAERTGEFFRYRILSSNLPTKTIEWRRTPDSSGVTLKMYGWAEHDAQLADESNAAVGIVYHMREKSSVGLVTRIYPSSGNQRVSLRYCSYAALSYALTNGCYITLSSDLYEPDSVTYSAGSSALETLSIRETYGDIVLDDEATFSELQAASDQLLLSAVHSLLSAHTRKTYIVEAYVPVALKPGQTVKILNATDAQPHADGVTNYAILDITEKMRNGRPYTVMTVAESMGLKRTLANSLSRTIRTVKQSIRRLEGRGSAGKGQTIVINPPSGGDGGDHTHAQYVPLAGGVTMAGNLAASPGVTFDGVDISAHAANPAAHHAPAYAANAAIEMIGNQGVGAKIGTASGLTIAGDGLNVLLESPSGLQRNASGLSVSDALAGDGLQMVSKVLRVGLSGNSGLQINGGLLQMGQPSAVAADSVGTVTGLTHSHAVISTDNANATPARLLKSDASGGLGLRRLGVGSGVTINATAFFKSSSVNDFTIHLKQISGQVADMWRVESVGGAALIRLTGGGDLESGNPGFVSGLKGWQIASEGDAEFNNVRVRGELHATTFVADELHATGGTMAVMTAAKISPPTSAGDNVLPALGSTFTLLAQASWESGLSYFSANDVVRIKPMGEVSSGGSLALYDIYVQIVSAGSLTGRNLNDALGKVTPGWYRMTARRLRGGSTGFVVPEGAAAVRWGRVSSSGYTGGMILTSDLQYSPYVDVFTVDATRSSTQWQNTNPDTFITPRVRLGNLRGVLGKSADEWGLAAATDLSDTSVNAPSLVASNLGVALRNIDLKLYRSGVNTVWIDADGNIKAGENVDNPLLTAFEVQAATGAVRLGPYGENRAHVVWDQANNALRIRNFQTDVIRFDADGSSYFAGRMTIGTAGEIMQGTGTPGAAGTWPALGSAWGTFTGVRLGRSGNVGRLAAFDSGQYQFATDTTGKLLAGAGAVSIDRFGLTLETYLTASPGWVNVSESNMAIKFKTAAGLKTGHIGSIATNTGSWRGVTMTAGDSVGHYVMVSTNSIELMNSGNVNIGGPTAPVAGLNVYGPADYSGNVEAQSFLSRWGLVVGEENLLPPYGTVYIHAVGSHPTAPPVADVLGLYVLKTGGSTFTLYMRKPGGASVAIATI